MAIPIAYEEAIKMADKTEPSEVTYVEWSEKAIADSSTKTMWLETQENKVDLIVPPPLPNGYEMVLHESWIELGNSMFNQRLISNYGLNYLGIVEGDLIKLYEAGIDLKGCRQKLADYMNSFTAIIRSV